MSQRKAIRPTLVKVVLAMMALSMVALFAVTVWGGYTQGWTWTGLGQYISPPTEPNQEYVRAKTFWDWMEVLIVPAMLAAGAGLLNRSLRTAEARRSMEQSEIESRRAEREKALVEDQSREQALQGYLDRLTELILEKGSRSSEPDAEVRDVARARTLTVLRGLDGARKGTLVRFLYESDLVVRKSKAIIDMIGADLSRADLREANLREADLRGAFLGGAYLSRADLRGADLREADLRGADLIRADLREADLRETNLSRADLRGADLSRVDLRGADLREANLSRADLGGAYLSRADLRGADLSRVDLRGANLIEADLGGADLREAQVTDEQVALAGSLKGATLPDGTVLD